MPAQSRPGPRRSTSACLAVALALVVAVFSMGTASAGAVTAPSAPQNLSAEQTGSDQVTVRWETPADPGGSAIEHYEAGWDQGTANDVEFPGSGERAFVFTGLSPGHYTFWVAAENAEKVSDRATVSLTVNGTTPTFTVSSASRTAASTVVVSGIWVTGERLSLQRALPGHSYTTIATINVDSTNNYSRSITVVNTATYRVETLDGSNVSPAHRVTVKDKVSLGATRKGVRSYRLAGRVYPAVRNQVVVLYVARSHGYSRLKTLHTSRTGYFSFTHRYGSRGTYHFKAVSRATSRNAAGSYARTVAVH